MTRIEMHFICDRYIHQSSCLYFHLNHWYSQQSMILLREQIFQSSGHTGFGGYLFAAFNERRRLRIRKKKPSERLIRYLLMGPLYNDKWIMRINGRKQNTKKRIWFHHRQIVSNVCIQNFLYFHHRCYDVRALQFDAFHVSYHKLNEKYKHALMVTQIVCADLAANG